MERVIDLVARILLSHIFLISGITKIPGYAETQGYMDAYGVPGSLLPLVIATEIIGGLSVLLGWKTRWGAVALAGFTLLAAFFFHADFSDQGQMVNYMKNLAMAGGLLLLILRGAGPWSIDARVHRRAGP